MQYQQKVAIEHKLRSATEQLVSTDKLIIKSFIDLCKYTELLEDILKSNLEYLTSEPSFECRGRAAAKS